MTRTRVQQSGIESGAVVLPNDSRLTDARTPTAHTHGNISNTGTIGSTANLPLITTTGGAVTTGAFGTTANSFCQGNDSRLSDARTPTSHAHGNITNGGAIGATANLPVITTTSGVLTTGTFGTAANSFCQGNDSRLSDARTPTSHNHGNITNGGNLGTTANVPLITSTGGAIVAGSFGTTANTFCQGNDSRLSNARTPTAHTHPAAEISDSTADGRAILTGRNVYACRAWVNFDGTGTVSIRASGNVTSITDTGVGNYLVNFATAMPDANYCPIVSSVHQSGVTFSSSCTTDNLQTTNFRVFTAGNSNNLFDANLVCAAVFR